MLQHRASVELRDLAGRLREVPRSGMIAVAKATKAIALEEARRATGDGRMSGIGRRGAKLRAVDDIRPGGQGTITCRVQGLPVGAWVMVNDGAEAHAIPGERKRRRRKPTIMGGGLTHPVRGTVAHPGMVGRGAWRAVAKRTAEVVPLIFGDELGRAVGS